MAQTEHMGCLIRGRIGEIVDVDVEENDMAWEEFIRVCVLVDVSRPLVRGKKIKVGLEAPCWI